MKTLTSTLPLLLSALITSSQLFAISGTSVNNDRKNSFASNMKSCIDNHTDSVFIYNEHDTSEIFFNYNLQGNVSNIIQKKYKSGSWINYSMSLTDYNATGLKELITEKIWMNNNWQNQSQTYFTYDANGNNLSYWRQDWIDSNWVKFELNNLVWDNNGHLLSQTVKNYDNGNWINVYLTQYSYNVNGKKISEIHQNWNGNSWENVAKEEYTYDVNNNITTMTEKFWINSSWENSTLFTYTWDINGNNLSLIRQIWNGTNWENSLKSIFTYDPSGNCLDRIYQNYFNGVWGNYIKCSYSYETGHIRGNAYGWDGSWTPGAYSIEIERYQSGGQKLLFSDWGIQVDFYCNELVTGLEELSVVNNPSIQMFPNPATDYVDITTSMPLTGLVSAKIFSIDGKLLSEVYQNYSVDNGNVNYRLPVNNLYPGTYVIEFRGKNIRSQQKLIVK